MNTSEKQGPDSSASVPAHKAPTPKRSASKPPAKSVARNKLKHQQRRRKATTARKGAKTAKILALLQRPSGASMQELRKATGWQAHSVRGFLSGAVKKKMGLRIDSAPREDGERAYRVASK
jgi:hypothetical protein